MADTNYDELNLKLFEEADKQFENHLNATNNNRIIFSGKFGHGKTTFLRWFFNQAEQKRKYNVIRLFPVNYSVASNEDIFEYIKYDILLEMLGNGYAVKDLDANAWSLAPFFIKDNKLKVASFLAKRLPMLGKALKSFEKDLVTLKKDFDKYCEEVTLELQETEVIKDFYKEFDDGKGSLYEQNAITELIRLMLKRGNIQEGDEENKKETILIIDDLDRIDPEHIFRILNVFAAHFDLHSSDNKFGFDKVMVVCDIENIRNVFKAKYGVDTDFNGYVDKFYSHRIFQFRIEKMFYRYVQLKLAQAPALLGGEVYQGDSHIIAHEKSVYINGNTFLLDMISLFVGNNLIDFRNSNKWKFQLLELNNTFSINKVEVPRKYEMFVIAIRFLCHMKGDSTSLKEAAAQIKHVNISKANFNHYYEVIVFLSCIASINFQEAAPSTNFPINGKDYILNVSNNIADISIINPSSGLKIKNHSLGDFKMVFNEFVDLLGTNNLF